MEYKNETENITTYDGHNIEIILNRSNTKGLSSGIVILTHGIFTDRDEKGRFVRLSQRLCDEGFDVARFNFRGHGSSPFGPESFTVSGAITDCIAVYLWAKKRGWENIGVIGSSFGGSIVLLERLLSTRTNLFGIALINPVVDYLGTFLSPTLEWAKEIFSQDAQTQIMHEGFAEVQPGFRACQAFLIDMFTMQPWRCASSIDSPTIVFHGDADDKVPLELTLKYLSTSSLISIDVIKGGGHAFKDPANEELVHGKIIDWFKLYSKGFQL